MQIRKIGLMIVGAVLFLSLISALEVKNSEFVIKTEAYNNMSIEVINPDTKEVVEIFKGRARKFGEFRFKYYGVINEVNLKISILNNETGETIKEEELGPYNLGTPTIPLEFYALEQKTSEQNQEEEIFDELNASKEVELKDENKSKSNARSLIQGLVVGENFEFSKVYYYFGAGVLGVLVLVFLLKKRISSSFSTAPVEPHPSKIIKANKTKPAKVEVKVNETPKESNQTNINETEKKISDLQKQLEQIRSEEKLLKLQKEIKQEQQSLKRMQEDLEDKNQPQNSNFENKSF